MRVLSDFQVAGGVFRMSTGRMTSSDAAGEGDNANRVLGTKKAGAGVLPPVVPVLPRDAL